MFNEVRSDVVDTPSDVIIVLSRLHLDRWQSPALIDTAAEHVRALYTGYGKKSRGVSSLWVSEIYDGLRRPY